MHVRDRGGVQEVEIVVVSEKTKAKIVNLIEGWDHHNHRASLYGRGKHQSIDYIADKIATVVERDQLQETTDSFGDELVRLPARLREGLRGSVRLRTGK